MSKLFTHKELRAFTLVETVVYIALLGLILTGAVVTAYQLVASSGSLNAKNTAGEEGTFVLRKLAWALSGAQIVSLPAGWGSSLSVTRYDGTVDMQLSGTAIVMRENNAPFATTTTPNVKVTSLSFHYIPAAGGAPAGLEASTTINGSVFYTKRYIRK
jgi:type II secretory pathway pseudopilin PulG